ncbi:expressed unknown protein [Seminavis robusta]|uniref:Uncharacterized protein n=1 Tax=Seminavis robusta TaxID=568900 RepID=A0A9N8D8L9_9STRA|nr:expressed unknown protein [Seminavis robusta]|eukprot:Sro32_g020690.1 n/a (245) ;mRNA; f:35364-36098
MVAVALLLLLVCSSNSVEGLSSPSAALQSRRAALASVVAGTFSASVAANAVEDDRPKFQRYPQLRFIAALGDPTASSGTGADQWGLWRDDPGPRGVFLRNYEILSRNNNQAPAGWTFDTNDWWLEEHGLIMSTPGPLPRKKMDKATQTVLPRKRYVVTGDRQVTTVLTVFEDGKWELQKGTLYDVTHLPCRSARYTSSNNNNNACSPTAANQRDFPVKPGAEMPPVPGCSKQDYAVLFVLGEEV